MTHTFKLLEKNWCCKSITKNRTTAICYMPTYNSEGFFKGTKEVMKTCRLYKPNEISKGKTKMCKGNLFFCLHCQMNIQARACFLLLLQIKYLWLVFVKYQNHFTVTSLINQKKKINLLHLTPAAGATGFVILQTPRCLGTCTFHLLPWSSHGVYTYVVSTWEKNTTLFNYWIAELYIIQNIH